ncbi:MAG: GNAT family N-acetyltransferase, partial [Draconibacterium sp.]|nr:GNAT family N-acetyltransferase [Draconibacterium sp.]
MIDKLKIRIAKKSDEEFLWEIIQKVISKGDTYVFNPDSCKEEMLAYWCGEDKHTYVAELNEKVVGTFILKDNFPGLGSHIANASFITSDEFSGMGIGRAMGEFSLQEAKRLGYLAMQFN